MPSRHKYGVHGEHSSANVYNSLDGDTGTASSGGSAKTNVSNSSNGKFTLTLDCDRLLKPDTNRTGIYTSKAAEEAAEHLKLSTLLPVPILDQIKIKLFHICGPIEFDEGSCLRALWDVGDWFVEQYGEIGKTARYEKSDRGIEEDWAEADATLLVIIN